MRKPSPSKKQSLLVRFAFVPRAAWKVALKANPRIKRDIRFR